MRDVGEARMPDRRLSTGVGRRPGKGARGTKQSTSRAGHVSDQDLAQNHHGGYGAEGETGTMSRWILATPTYVQCTRRFYAVDTIRNSGSQTCWNEGITSG